MAGPALHYHYNMGAYHMSIAPGQEISRGGCGPTPTWPGVLAYGGSCHTGVAAWHRAAQWVAPRRAEANPLTPPRPGPRGRRPPTAMPPTHYAVLLRVLRTQILDKAVFGVII